LNEQRKPRLFQVSQQCPQSDSEDVLNLWDNLPPVAKGISVAGIITYIATLLFAVATQGYISWYATMGLLIWPLILIAWLIVIWLAIAVFSAARVLVGEKKIGDSRKMLLKTVIFVPTVIGTALTVVEVFVSDVFSSPEKEDDHGD
jgi:hypothetical protein